MGHFFLQHSNKKKTYFDVWKIKKKRCDHSRGVRALVVGPLYIWTNRQVGISLIVYFV